jgi:hypothetical protein
MNRALCVFAGSRVISPDDGTAEAMHCGLAWDGVRDGVLAVYPWGFATKWARLARKADAPAFGFKHAYGLPDDFLYLIDIRAEDDLTARPVHHLIVAGAKTDGKHAVCTDAEQAFARYVFRHENCELWPPHFCEAFCLRLAADVAPYLTQDAGSGVRLRELYNQALALAATADDKQDNAPPVRETCDYIDGRQR